MLVFSLYFNILGKKKLLNEKQEFTKEQREKIVEMLLSQERVLALLYDKTFPTKNEETKKENEEPSLENTNKVQDKLLPENIEQITP